MNRLVYIFHAPELTCLFCDGVMASCIVEFVCFELLGSVSGSSCFLLLALASVLVFDFRLVIGIAAWVVRICCS